MSAQNPLNREVNHDRSITQLTVTKNGFIQFVDIWLNHLADMDWADSECIKLNLEKGNILIPVYMIAFKRVEGTKLRPQFVFRLKIRSKFLFRQSHLGSD